MTRRNAFASVSIGVALALTLLLAMQPTAVDAHHSIAGQFDMTKTLRLNGVVSRVDWTNPHVYIYFDAKDESGVTVNWKLETLPVAMLRKAGIKKDMLLTGETVTMDIVPARDGTAHLGFILIIKFPDGRKFQFSRDPNGGVEAVK